MATARYLEREKANRERASFNESAQPQHMRDALASWYIAGDLNFTKLILSPEHGAEVNLKDFTRHVMSAIERDHATRLEWLAVIHTNTDHPHVHVVLRQRDLPGREFALAQDYLHHTLRIRAREEMTRMIGYRDPAERLRTIERCQQITRSRREQHDIRAYGSLRS